MKRVLIVDHHPEALPELARAVAGLPEAELVGAAASAQECVDALADGGVDVVLLHINLADAFGVEVCRTLAEQRARVRVMAIASHGECSLAGCLVDGAASGYILHHAEPQAIRRGLEQAMAEVETEAEPPQPQSQPAPNGRCARGAMLTPREAELLRLVCEGCTNQEIAARMHLGFETVCGYRKNLLLKLNARNTAVLVRRALERRLV